MQLHILRSADRLYHSVASWITAEIILAVENRGKCSIALSGGSTPKNVYDLLKQAPFDKDIPWGKVYFFWGDERMVGYDDEQNNARMALDALLDQVPVPKENIFRMPSTLPPDEAEEQYNRLLHEYFSSEDEFSFDIVLLGMGDDGHTLSLFPGTAILNETEKWVTTYYADHLKQSRITLLPALVNKCRRAAFIVSGASKAASLKSVLSPVKNEQQFPAQLIKPTNGELHWFVDDAATAGTDFH